MTVQAVPWRPAASVPLRRPLQQVVLIVAAAMLLIWTVFPFVWILLTSLKSPGDILSVPPKFVFAPTFDNYAALVMGEQRGQYSSTRPDFPLFFLNSIVISVDAAGRIFWHDLPLAGPEALKARLLEE